MTNGRYADDDDYSPLGRTDSVVLASANSGADPYQAIFKIVQSATGTRFDAREIDQGGPLVEQSIRQLAREEYQKYNDAAVTRGLDLIREEVETVCQRMINDILGMGALDSLLALEGVEDIALNGPDEVFVKRFGKWEYRPEVSYPDSEALLRKVNQGIAHTGRQAGPVIPIVDAALKSGHRVNIVTHPIASPWPIISIRKRNDASLSLSDLVKRGGGAREGVKPLRIPDYFAQASGDGVFTPLAAVFLHICMIAGFNVLVIGSTGVGKTTLLNALGKAIPEDRRILVIEDTRELDIRPAVEGRPHNCIYFTTRAESVEGIKPVGQDALVRAALRQRPDALAVGEARGAEIFDMFKAMWTGHRNGLTSIHAEGIGEVPERMRMMLQEASFSTEISEETVSLWIAKSFNIAIALRLTETGQRVVEEIVEFTGGVEGRIPGMNRLFDNRDGRGLRFVGGRLYRELQWQQAGYSFDLIRKAAVQMD